MSHIQPGIEPGSITKSPNSHSIFNWMKISSENWGEDPHLGGGIFVIYTVCSVHMAVVCLHPSVLHFLSNQWINFHLDSKQFSVDDLCPEKSISILRNRKSFPGMPECLMLVSVVERCNISKSKQTIQSYRIHPGVICCIYVLRICNFLPPPTTKFLLLYSTL